MPVARAAGQDLATAVWLACISDLGNTFPQCVLATCVGASRAHTDAFDRRHVQISHRPKGGGGGRGCCAAGCGIVWARAVRAAHERCMPAVSTRVRRHTSRAAARKTICLFCWPLCRPNHATEGWRLSQGMQRGGMEPHGGAASEQAGRQEDRRIRHTAPATLRQPYARTA